MSITHRMHISSEYFQQIMNGVKTVDIRPYNNRRKHIQVGDAIVFIDKKSGQKKFAVVRALVIGKLAWVLANLNYHIMGVEKDTGIVTEMERIYGTDLNVPIEQQPLFVAFVLEV